MKEGAGVGKSARDLCRTVTLTGFGALCVCVFGVVCLVRYGVVVGFVCVCWGVVVS